MTISDSDYDARDRCRVGRVGAHRRGERRRAARRRARTRRGPQSSGQCRRVDVRGACKGRDRGRAARRSVHRCAVSPQGSGRRRRWRDRRRPAAGSSPIIAPRGRASSSCATSGRVSSSSARPTPQRWASTHRPNRCCSGLRGTRGTSIIPRADRAEAPPPPSPRASFPSWTPPMEEGRFASRHRTVACSA